MMSHTACMTDVSVSVPAASWFLFPPARSSGVSSRTKGQSSHHHYNSQGPIPPLLSIETQPNPEPTGCRRRQHSLKY